ncbi:MAG: aldehyde dehydrogenase family protein [Pseudomonadota bacterium]
MVTQYKNLINGEMVDTGEWLDVVNPANETVIGQVPACGADELDKAVAAARAAFKAWKNSSFEERQAACMAISGAIKENADELYRLLTSEQGKPHAQAKGEIFGGADGYRRPE